MTRSSTGLIISSFAVASKLVFSLLVVKLILVKGETGSLTAWGNIQNAATITAAILGLSVQSGVAATYVARTDPLSITRAILLLTAMSLVVTTGYLVIQFFFEVPYFFGLALGTFLLPAYFLALQGYLSSYLPVVGKLGSLAIMNLTNGAALSVAIYTYDVISAERLVIGLTLAGGVSCAFPLYQVRNSIRIREALADIRNDLTYQLMRYGFASVVNASVTLGGLLLVRAYVSSTGGLAVADTLEVSLRIVALIEASIGAVMGILIWKRIGDGKDISSSALIFSFLATVIAIFLWALFQVFGELLIVTLFTPNNVGVLQYKSMFLVYAFLKVVYAFLVLPIYIAGRLSVLIVAEVVGITVLASSLAIGFGRSDAIETALSMLIFSATISSTMLIYFNFRGYMTAVKKAVILQTKARR